MRVKILLNAVKMRRKRGLNAIKTRPERIYILFKRGERALKTQKRYPGGNENDGAYRIRGASGKF